MVGFKFGSIVTSRTRTTCELKAPQIIGFHSRAFLPLIDFHPSTIPAYKTLKLLSDLLNKDDIAEDMEQPLNPSPQQLPPTTASVSGGGRNSDNNNSDSQKRRLPTPQELMSHYESQGLEPQEAAVKVIDDLQHMLYKLATSGRGRKDRFMAEASRKLDTANARLAIVEMRLDSKPGFAESLAIGVASAASFRGIAAVWPHVFGAVAQIWNSVRSSTSKP